MLSKNRKSFIFKSHYKINVFWLIFSHLTYDRLRSCMIFDDKTLNVLAKVKLINIPFMTNKTKTTVQIPKIYYLLFLTI